MCFYRVSQIQGAQPFMLNLPKTLDISHKLEIPWAIFTSDQLITKLGAPKTTFNFNNSQNKS